MAKLVTKFKYLKPGSNAAGKYIKYIATVKAWKGLMIQKYAPATVKQKQFIEKMLLDFPDAAESLEYEDYIAKPNRINASELISRTMENNIDVIADSKPMQIILQPDLAHRNSDHTDYLLTMVLQ